jgi:K+-transporting ATPase, c chain
MSKLLRQSFMLLLVLSVITGVLYPLAATAWPAGVSAAGQRQPGRTRRQAGGSALIGQSFTDPKYFWGRPSATAPNPYNASASSGPTRDRPTRRWPTR